MWKQKLAALKAIEPTTGKGFGDAQNPLLVSCRSGSKESMLGMMECAARKSWALAATCRSSPCPGSRG
jgi:hypothetical protein